MSNTETPQLSEEELKLLEEYRSGKLTPSAKKVIDGQDLLVLNEADSRIKSLLYELGMLEEHKNLILKALHNTRDQKNSLLQEVMLKYGIPANNPFKINRDTGVVDFDLAEEAE